MKQDEQQRIDERVALLVAGWPPLTDEKIDRIAGLLQAARPEAKAGA